MWEEESDTVTPDYVWISVIEAGGIINVYIHPLQEDSAERSVPYCKGWKEWYIAQNGSSWKACELWSPAALCSTTYNMGELDLSLNVHRPQIPHLLGVVLCGAVLRVT